MSTSPSVATKRRSPIRKLLHLLGPGLVTGASDNDPSGVATYSQAGAQFGFGMLWTMIFVYPFMGGIQDISARIGRVTGHGIAGNLRRYYSKRLTYAVVGLMVVANIALRRYVRTLLKCSINTIAEAIKLIPPLLHPILEYEPPIFNLVEVWRIGR